jgi:hypothetical protein
MKVLIPLAHQRADRRLESIVLVRNCDRVCVAELGRFRFDNGQWIVLLHIAVTADCGIAQYGIAKLAPQPSDWVSAWFAPSASAQTALATRAGETATAMAARIRCVYNSRCSIDGFSILSK